GRLLDAVLALRRTARERALDLAPRGEAHVLPFRRRPAVALLRRKAIAQRAHVLLPFGEELPGLEIEVGLGHALAARRELAEHAQRIVRQDDALAPRLVFIPVGVRAHGHDARAHRIDDAFAARVGHHEGPLGLVVLGRFDVSLAVVGDDAVAVPAARLAPDGAQQRLTGKNRR